MERSLNVRICHIKIGQKEVLRVTLDFNEKPLMLYHQKPMSPILILIVKLTRLFDDAMHIHLMIFSSGKNSEINRKSEKNLNSSFF